MCTIILAFCNTILLCSITCRLAAVDSVRRCQSDADSESDYSDYLNHSCNPNVGMDDCLTVIAINDISAGEELVYDYAFCEADEQWRLKAVCNCGSTNCRKTITGEDWKLFGQSHKLFPFFSPFIRRRIIAYEKEKV